MALPPDSASTLPTVPVPPSPRKKRLTIRVILSAIAVVLIVAVLLGALQMVRGASATHRADAQPNATATSALTSNDATATDTPTAGTPTPRPRPRPAATSTPAPQIGPVKIIQNQDVRPTCVDNPTPYTVVLRNTGSEIANWHVTIGALFASKISAIPRAPAYWASVSPQSGSVAPGQLANFTMTVQWPIPCSGNRYIASVQLDFPSGATQPDLVLTYAGTGPEPYADVVVVSGTLNFTQPCPVGGAAPSPFTFAIKNNGNYYAGITIVAQDLIGSNVWATLQRSKDPPQPDTDFITAGQTWTITVSPRADVSCAGTVYHVYVYTDFNNTKYSTITFTDVFK